MTTTGGPAAMAERLNLLPPNIDHQLILRILFAGHFSLTALVLLSSWPPISFLFCNSFLLGGLLWAGSSSLDLPLIKCLFVETVAIVLDLVLFLSFYPTSTKAGIDLLAFVAAAIQTLGRFLGILALQRIRKERLESSAGSYETVAGFSSHSNPTAASQGMPQMAAAPPATATQMPSGYGYNEAPRSLGGGYPDLAAGGRRVM